MKFQTAVAVESYQKHGEDRAEVFETPDGIVVVVADGVGGQPGGGRAADLVVSLIREGVAQLSQQEWADSLVWADLLTQIDHKIFADPDAGMTTCVIVALPRNPSGTLVGASVGDSEAWIVTEDDWIELTEHQAKFEKSFLGRGDAFGIPIFNSLEAKATLVVATDGLFKYADADQICAAVRQADLVAAAHDLIGLVRFPSGGLPDDIAVVLCRQASG